MQRARVRLSASIHDSAACVPIVLHEIFQVRRPVEVTTLSGGRPLSSAFHFPFVADGLWRWLFVITAFQGRLFETSLTAASQPMMWVLSRHYHEFRLTTVMISYSNHIAADITSAFTPVYICLGRPFRLPA